MLKPRPKCKRKAAVNLNDRLIDHFLVECFGSNDPEYIKRLKKGEMNV